MGRLIQKYIPYLEWEDWINGMWRTLEKKEEDEMLQKAIKFTGNHIEYGEAMQEVVMKWTRTMENSLSNKSINRRAFLGHCAVQYKINCPEYITRMAWKKLTDNQRFLADKVAQQIINKWENDYRNKSVRKDMGRQMLLPWYI